MSLKPPATHSAAPTTPAALLHHFTLTTAAVTTNHQQVAPTDQESQRPPSQRSGPLQDLQAESRKYYQHYRADSVMLDVSFPVVDLHINL